MLRASWLAGWLAGLLACLLAFTENIIIFISFVSFSETCPAGLVAHPPQDPIFEHQASCQT